MPCPCGTTHIKTSCYHSYIVHWNPNFCPLKAQNCQCNGCNLLNMCGHIKGWRIKLPIGQLRNIGISIEPCKTILREGYQLPDKIILTPSDTPPHTFCGNKIEWVTNPRHKQLGYDGYKVRHTCGCCFGAVRIANQIAINMNLKGQKVPVRICVDANSQLIILVLI